MARAVNGIAIQVQILEIATLASNRAVGAAHTRLFVTANHMFGATQPDGGTSVLNIELETPHLTLVLQIPGLGTGRNVRGLMSPVAAALAGIGNVGDTECLTTVKLREVAGHVHVAVTLGSVHTVNSAVKDRTPVPIHLTIAQLNASQVP